MFNYSQTETSFYINFSTFDLFIINKQKRFYKFIFIKPVLVV